MSLTTYAGLQAFVATVANRGDLTTAMPDFIALAEARMNRLLAEKPVAQMLTRSTVVASTEFVAVPTDYLAARSLRSTASPPFVLQYLTPEQMGDYKSTQPSGNVTAYAIVNGYFEFGPAPATSQNVGLTYYAKPAALSVSNTSNWILASYPDAYVRGTMLEIKLFIEDDPGVAKYEALFQSAMNAISEADRRNLPANLSATPSSSATP